MKKTILIFFVLVVLSSCEKSDLIPDKKAPITLDKVPFGALPIGKISNDTIAHQDSLITKHK